MNKKKWIGVLIVSVGFLILLYKDSGHYGFDYFDKSWENIGISLVLFVIGFFFIKKSESKK